MAVGSTLLNVAGRLTTPLLPDDYLGYLNPLWSRREPRARVQAVVPETADAATLWLRPGPGWPAHAPGQYVRMGVDIDGVRHWRTYSLTSVPGRRDGRIAICVKATPDGFVSRHLVRDTAPGTVVRLAPPAGEYVLPRPLPARITFVTAGSGVTPVMGMLRALEQGGALPEVDHVHLAPAPRRRHLRHELRRLAERHAGRYRLHEHHDDASGLFSVASSTSSCPAPTTRPTWACGPAPLLDALAGHFEAAGAPELLTVERFRPCCPPPGAEGEGGTVTFTRSGRTVEADGATPLLVAARRPGACCPRAAGWVSAGRASVASRPAACATCARASSSPRIPPSRTSSRPACRPPPAPSRSISRKDTMSATTTATRPTPLPHLTEADLDALGAELDALGREVRATLGEDDARYIRKVIGAQRGMEIAGRGLLMAGLLPPAWLGGTALLSVAKILENMEIGHNVMHGQWDWMRDPEIHSTTWEWDNVSSSEGWRKSHNFEHHTFTNVVGKDRDLGYTLLRVDPDQPWNPIYLAQPVYNIALALGFQWGVALYDLELENVVKGTKPWSQAKSDIGRFLRKARKQITKDYIVWPALSGRARCPRSSGRSPRTSPATSGPTRSSSAGTSPTGRRRSTTPRRPSRASRAGPGTCASSSARRTSRATRCSTS
jgi:ferredoxin-NADP reductase